MRSGLILPPLLGKSLQDRRRGLIGWCTGIAGIIAVQMSVYPSIRSSATDWQSVVDTFPEALQKMLRMSDYGTDAGYLSTELLSFVMPFIFIGLGASWGARMTTEDEETGNADILLSLPISRHQFVATRFAAAFVALGAGVLTMFLGLVIGARILDMIIPISRFAGTALVLFLLGAIGLAGSACIGAGTGHRGAALGITLSVFVALFVLYSLAPLVSFIDAMNPYNPLQWTLGAEPLLSGVDPWPTLAAVALIAVGTVFTFVLFRGRDIRG